MAKKYIWSILLLLGFSVLTLSGDEFRKIEIGKDNKVQIGLEFENMYTQVVALNPSVYAGKPSAEDFNAMPRKTVDGDHAADEREAKHRIFFRPYLRASTVGTRSLGVTGIKDWEMRTQPGRVTYNRDYKRENIYLKTEFSLALPSDLADMQIEVRLKNTGKRACKVEFGSEFIFLKDELEPLNLMLQREVTRYSNGQRQQYLTNDYTKLTGNTQSYWWRRIVKDQRVFGYYVNRELIPFTYPRLEPPSLFGAVSIFGNGTLLWDMRNTEKLSLLDVSWDVNTGKLMPVWKMEIKGKEEKVIVFKVITLRNIHNINAITDDWIFGYKANSDQLHITSAPLKPQPRTALQTTVKDPGGMVIIQQRNEVTSCTPFRPARVELRATSSFIPNVPYSIKMLLRTLPSEAGEQKIEQLADLENTFLP